MICGSSYLVPKILFRATTKSIQGNKYWLTLRLVYRTDSSSIAIWTMKWPGNFLLIPVCSARLNRNAVSSPEEVLCPMVVHASYFIALVIC